MSIGLGTGPVVRSIDIADSVGVGRQFALAGRFEIVLVRARRDDDVEAWVVINLRRAIGADKSGRSLAAGLENDDRILAFGSKHLSGAETLTRVEEIDRVLLVRIEARQLELSAQRWRSRRPIPSVKRRAA